MSLWDYDAHVVEYVKEKRHYLVMTVYLYADEFILDVDGTIQKMLNKSNRINNIVMICIPYQHFLVLVFT